MSEEHIKTFMARQLYWLGCVMHDPLVLPLAFEIAYCAIGRLNTKKGSPVRYPQQVSQRAADGFHSSSARPWRAAHSCE